MGEVTPVKLEETVDEGVSLEENEAELELETDPVIDALRMLLTESEAEGVTEVSAEGVSDES